MDSSSIFFGGSIIAVTVAGMSALFALCCISVILPAYFARSFQNRRLLVAMTFLFAAGVATVILPIAMRAAFVRRLIIDEHTAIYVTGGLLMLVLAVYVLLGGRLHLPMPGRRAGGGTGPLGGCSSCGMVRHDESDLFEAFDTKFTLNAHPRCRLNQRTGRGGMN